MAKYHNIEVEDDVTIRTKYKNLDILPSSIDLAAAEGSEIRSFADGIIVEIGNSAIFGKYIKVNHKDGFVTFYAHLSEYCGDEGKQIKMGEIIGKAGTTGVATGPHLHFEVRKDGKSIDPSQYI